jgi:hypothetical protein
MTVARYEGTIDLRGPANDAIRMLKRVVSLIIWFYAGWTLGGLIAYTTGVSELIGPILGIACAAIFVGDPRHLIWVRPAKAAPTVA